MEMWQVYLFTRLDIVHEVLVALILLNAVSLGCAIVFALCGDDSRNAQENEKVKSSGRKLAKVSCAFLVIVTSVKILLPTQNEAAAIYLIPKMVNSEFTKEAQTIPVEATKLLKLKLDAWMSEMNPVKK